MGEGLCYATISQLARMYRSRELSPVDLVDVLLARIDEIDPALNTYVTVCNEEVRKDAVRAERALSRRTSLSPLHGVPISVKDNIATAGVRTTAGSRILSDWVPAEDAGCLKRLRSAGALIVGKTKLFEFAFGEAHDDYGHVRNPWKLDRSTAGSSTGSAAAVAAGLCFGSVATDTGGSIRVPAALCGVAGLKPTYRRVPRDGVISTAWTMCHVGPIARTVEDIAYLFSALAGEDCVTSLEHGISKLRLAVAIPQAGEAIDPDVREAFNDACVSLETQVAGVEQTELPDLLMARAALWTIASAEAADIHHEWISARPDDYHPIVRSRLQRGNRVSATAYVRAQRVRSWLIRELDARLGDCDALLLPVSPITAYALGAREVTIKGQQEEVSQAVTRYTPLASLAGWPALTVPCGFSSDGLPIGFQIVGRPFREEIILRIGRVYEQSQSWHERHPASWLDKPERTIQR